MVALAHCLTIVIGTAEHQFYGSIGDFLRKHGESAWAKACMAFLSANPTVAAIAISLIVIVVLATLAFFETRPGHQSGSLLVESRQDSIPFSVRDIYWDRGRPEDTFKLKQRIVLTNDTKESIEIRPPIWDSGQDGAPPQGRWSCLQVEVTNGWRQNKWQSEAQVIRVHPGEAFRASVSLDPAMHENDLRRRLITRRLGILVLPTTTSNYERDVRIPI